MYHPSRKHNQIQQLFLHQGLILGKPINFEKWCGSSPHCRGWQEIVFSIHPTRTSIQFQGVDVFWGNAAQKAVLFGSDCSGIQSKIGQRDFWTLLLPFCETVLALSQHSEFAPMIRVDTYQVEGDYPTSHFFELPNFDYATLEWSHLVPSLATPISIGA